MSTTKATNPSGTTADPSNKSSAGGNGGSLSGAAGGAASMADAEAMLATMTLNTKIGNMVSTAESFNTLSLNLTGASTKVTGKVGETIKGSTS